MFGLTAFKRFGSQAIQDVVAGAAQDERAQGILAPQARERQSGCFRFGAVEQSHAADWLPAFLDAFSVNDIPADTIESDRVRGEEEGLFPPGGPGLVPAAGSALID